MRMAQRSNNPESNLPGAPQQSQRRKLIKTLTSAGGATLLAKSAPNSWTAPLVESVSLPAHAQLSSISGDFGAVDFDGSLVASMTLNLLVPEAHAGGIDPNTYHLDICFQVENGEVTFLIVNFIQDSATLPAAAGQLPKPLTEPIMLDVSAAATLQKGQVDFIGPNGTKLAGIVTLEDTLNAVAEYPFSAGNSPCFEAGP